MPRRTVYLWRWAIDLWNWSDWRHFEWHGRAGEQVFPRFPFVSIGPFDLRWLPPEKTQSEEPGDE